MGDHILVAYDGSEESARACEFACEMGNAMDSSITVVHAVQPDVYEAASGEVQSNFADEYRRQILRTIDEAEETGQDCLAEATEIARAHDHEATAELLYGDPINEVLEYAGSEDVDMIVVGHRGRSAGPMLGSVAKAIVERADVPVVVAR